MPRVEGKDINRFVECHPPSVDKHPTAGRGPKTLAGSELWLSKTG
jgi:hypothetical protein